MLNSQGSWWDTTGGNEMGCQPSTQAEGVQVSEKKLFLLLLALIYIVFKSRASSQGIDRKVQLMAPRTLQVIISFYS